MSEAYELSRLASLDGISDWNQFTVDPESTDVDEVENLWPMMDPLMDKNDMKPRMLHFNLDSDSQTLTMLDSIANSIKLETPDADDYMSLPCSLNESALSASDIVTSMSMTTFETCPATSTLTFATSLSNTPTVVPVGNTHKMTPVHSTSNGTKSPQCKVCNDESSGFHYGVDSCEGCKGFFRRCITQGMTHKCSNSEKCEITPFTRNSCQYCRLKKCFAVGMSREASRLGRRPKKLKDPNAENVRSHTGNVPIAPYPTPAEVHLIRMAELQRLLQANGTFKTELMQAFLSVQTSLQEQYGSMVPGQDIKPLISTAQVTVSPVSSTMVKSHISLSEAGPRTLALPSVNTGQACSSTSKPMLNVSPMNCDPANPNMNIRGLESGYSSMNSPGSSKSQSPIQYTNLTNNNVGQMQPISEDMFAMDNGNAISHNDNNNINLMLPPGMHLDTNIANMFSQSQQAGGGKSMMSTMVHNAMENAGPQNSMPINLPQSPVSQPGSSGTPIVFKLAGAERILTLVKQPAIKERKDMLQKVTEIIVGAHLDTCRITHENVAAAIHLSPRLRDEDKNDVETNSLKMWNQFVENMVNEITSVVTFCKRLPGFIEICQDDQIHLIKQGSFECFFARFSMLVDCMNQQMLDPLMAFKCSRKIIHAMPMGDFFEEFFGVADLLNPLELTDGEIGLFAAVLVMCPDRTDLKNRKTIVNLQGLFYQALYLLIKSNHHDGEDLFERLLNMIPKLRDINNQHCMALNNIKMKAPEKVDEFPDLHKEVYFEN